MAKIPSGRDWDTLLEDAAILQAKLPGAVLVGGTAAALHARHRISFDHDHVIRDFGKRFDEALSALESITGWRTKRRIRGNLILGEMHHIDAGLRNLRRAVPLETSVIRTPNGGTLAVPTAWEILRIKAFLLVERSATRDYLDVAALSKYLGTTKSIESIQSMEGIYTDFVGEGGDILLSVVVKLANPDPYDLTDVDLSEYKGIAAPWNSWSAVEHQCRSLARALLER